MEKKIVKRAENVDFTQIEKMTAIGKALSSELRIRLLQELEEQTYNVNEISELLNIPASSAAMHVKVLEDAGLIVTELKVASRGSMKVCSKCVGNIFFNLTRENNSKIEKISMPIGNYVDYHVEPTCGIVSEEGYIDIEDEPAVFYNPNRIKAKLIWIGNGYLEYRFPNAVLKKNELEKLELTAEVCAEDHEYNPEFPSDITVWINDQKIGTWECPGDFGGRRGKLNPSWWPLQNTQYGNLKTWSVTNKGCFLDKEQSEKITLKELKLEEPAFISVKIGIDKDASHKGGLNLFGDGFGDYPQDIVLKLTYK